MYVDVARLRRNCLFIGKCGNINIYLRTIEFSFLHSACCPDMQHVLCRNWKILIFVSRDTMSMLMKGVVTYVY